MSTPTPRTDTDTDLAGCICRTHPYDCTVHPVGGTEFAYTEAERRAMRRKAMQAFGVKETR